MTNTSNQPANSNPWYILMTLHGEQTGDTINRELHRDNMNAWNRFSGLILSNPLHMELIHQSDLKDELKQVFPSANSDEGETLQRHEEAKLLFCEANRKRTGGIMTGPKITDIENIVDLSNLRFDKLLCCEGFLFPVPVIVENCTFEKEVNISKTVFVAGTTLRESSFELGFDHSGSYQHEEFKIESTRFGLDSYINNCQFASNVYFSRVAFYDSLAINNSEFSGYVALTFCHFHRDLNFTESRFQNKTSLVLCMLNDAQFRDVEFKNEAGFPNNFF